MASLRLEDYIKQLQDPVPEFRDPEDFGDEASGRLAPRAAEDEGVSLPAEPSALRRRAAASNLWDSAGRKTTRRELYEDSDEESVSEFDSDGGELEREEGEERLDDGDDVDDEEEEDDNADEAEESEDGNTESGDVDDDDDDGDNDDDDDDNEKEEEDVEEDEGDEEITSVESEGENVIQDTAIDEGEKAEAVVQQLDLWDRLMEARIQLQKVLSMVNRLPPSPESQTPPLLPAARDVLLEMNHALHDVISTPSSPSRKRKPDVDTDELARESYESLAKDRNTTLTFWDEKTRLASKKFKSFKSYQTPVVKQVEQILSDRDRLVRRTQVLRDSDGPDLCDEPAEVYDDGDFYQRLLKNLIERKTDEASVSSSSQWLEVQRLRGRKKKKKDIDTRASKGRKLRYNVHSKLVNIMAPQDNSTWSNDAKSELFKNLFKMPGHHEL